MAGWAGGGRHVSQEPLAVTFRGGFFQVLLQETYHSTKANSGGLFLSRSTEQQILCLGGKFFKRSGKINLVSGAHDFQHAVQVGGTGAWAQSAIQQRLGPVRSEERRV